MIACHVYVDFDNDGAFTTAGDDLSAYWVSTDLNTGMTGPDQQVASVGRCALLLDNTAQLFSPRNTTSTYYGKLLPGLPVRVDATDGVTSWTIFRGVTMRWQPSSGHIHGDRRCKLDCMDFAGRLQRTEIALPMQYDATADAVIAKICASAFGGGQATGYLDLHDTPADGDTVTIGNRTYTFRNALTGDPDEVLISSDSEEWYTARNLALAVNAGIGAGTQYGSGTTRHTQVTANADPVNGYPDSLQDGGLNLQDVASAYEALGIRVLRVSARAIVADSVWLYLKKTGTPTGTLTVTLEATAGFDPTGTPITADATATLDEADLDTNYAWVEFVFAGTVTVDPYLGLYVVLTTDRAASAVNYVTLGVDTSGAGVRMKTAGTWSAIPAMTDDAIFWLPAPRVTFDANARGAWGNVALSTDSSAVSVSGATLTGGSDAPAGLTSFETGVETFERAADQWSSNTTNGLTAVKDCVESEHNALFWVAADGTLTFKNRHWIDKQHAVASVLTLVNHPDAAVTGVDYQDIANSVRVDATPLGVGAEGVIATAAGGIKAYPTTTVKRLNLLDAPDFNTQTLNFIDGDTKTIIGAEDIVTPVLGVDFTVTTEAGVPFTDDALVGLGVAVAAGEVQATGYNLSGRVLLINNLQVRGKPLFNVDRQSAVYENATSISTYGKAALTWRLPFFSTMLFAQAVASYEGIRRSTPREVLSGLSFKGVTEINGVNLHSLDIGDKLTISDQQAKLDEVAVLVWGRRTRIGVGNISSITLTVLELDDAVWLLGVAGYSELGVTTRLGL